MTLLGERRHRAEILDEHGQEPEALNRSLAHVSAVNRWLGGDRALRLHLDDLLLDTTGGARVLDVGVGDAGVVRRLRNRYPERVRFVGVDQHPEIVRIAEARTRAVAYVEVVRADGLRLPFPDRTFDAVLCTLTLHHFGGPDAVELLREMSRVARLRIVVNDLERSLPNYLGARLLARTAWRDCPITRNDGPLSVLRAFTPGELRKLAREAALEGATVHRHFPFRLILNAGPSAGEADEPAGRG